MDIYHKVLLDLYNVTGGRDSKTVDLKDLVKNQGFLGSFDEIYQMLSMQGWIAETPKLNFVRITHWGVSEIKNSTAAEPPAVQAAKKEAARLISETKQFINMLEEFIAQPSAENLGQMQKKSDEINTAIGSLKSSIE